MSDFFFCFSDNMTYLQIRLDNVRKIKSNNYDMTILHDDELENPHLATVRRRKKKTPSWANSKFFLFFPTKNFYLSM